jgi:hypothetical protein
MQVERETASNTKLASGWEVVTNSSGRSCLVHCPYKVR